MDNVGALYAVMGQQLVDNLKSNYIELAGGDPDSVNVPDTIIQDGFMDEEPVDENTLTTQDEQPEGAGVDETTAPTGQAGTGIATAQPDPETAESEAAEPEAPQPETKIADTSLPKTLPVSSPVRVPPVQTVEGNTAAGGLTLEDAELAQQATRRFRQASTRRNP